MLVCMCVTSIDMLLKVFIQLNGLTDWLYTKIRRFSIPDFSKTTSFNFHSSLGLWLV